MSNTAKIGVVTVLYNSEPVLPDFFASIAAQSYRNFTVFAVDNASTDRSLDLCHEHGATCIENPENDGVAAANNQGIAAALAAGCEFILLLNNDVRFNADLFAQLLDGLHAQACDMTTPLMYFYDAPETIWYAGGGFDWWAGLRQRHYGEGSRDTGQFTQPQRVAYTPSCCVLIRSEVFARIGVMDERYFLYWDDTDFMLRAHRAGVSLYLIPTAKLWHKVGALTGRQSDFAERYSTRNHAFYLRKHLPVPGAAFFWIAYGTAFAVCALVSRRYRMKLGAWIEGLRMPLE